MKDLLCNPRYPESITQRSMYDMELNSGDGLTHLYYSKGDELWPFGFGLSYTTFSYTWSASTAAMIEAAAPLTTAALAAESSGYECTVKNTGSVAGDAVVLGFVNSTEPQFPRQKLFDFERVSLQPGESKTVLRASLLKSSQHRRTEFMF